MGMALSVTVVDVVVDDLVDVIGRAMLVVLVAEGQRSVSVRPAVLMSVGERPVTMLQCAGHPNLKRRGRSAPWEDEPRLPPRSDGASDRAGLGSGGHGPALHA